MASHRVYALLITASMCLSSLGCERTPTVPTENHLKVASPRDGKQWLAWSSVSREDFVLAYIDGYYFGVKDACALPNPDPKIRLKRTLDCRRKAPRFSTLTQDRVSVDVSTYAGVLTKFYSEHPEYQNIPFAYLMRYLSDEQHKTADDLYNMAKSAQIATNCVGGSTWGSCW